MATTKLSKIYIPPASSVRDTGNRVDFWFSEDIQDWQPKRQKYPVDRRVKHETKKMRL